MTKNRTWKGVNGGVVFTGLEVTTRKGDHPVFEEIGCRNVSRHAASRPPTGGLPASPGDGSLLRHSVDSPSMLPSAPSGFRGVLRVDDDARAVYSESAGIMRLHPAAVAIPVDAHDLQLLCAWATEHGATLLPRGSGSSMSGAAVGTGIVVDTHRLQHIDAIDLAYARLRVGAAVTRSRADAMARGHGLRLPVDPSSGAFATIGGMVATNAAGPSSMHFGSMRRWVRSVDCVFADGSSATVTRQASIPANPTLQRWGQRSSAFRDACRVLPRRRVRKESSGYGVHDFADSGDLVDLLVGSEGTLAFFHQRRTGAGTDSKRHGVAPVFVAYPRKGSARGGAGP